MNFCSAQSKLVAKSEALGWAARGARGLL